jgi:hypothetical protein
LATDEGVFAVYQARGSQPPYPTNPDSTACSSRHGMYVQVYLHFRSCMMHAYGLQ